MDIKKVAIIFNLVNLFLLAAVVQAELKIDFSRIGGRVEAGYEGYFAGHESPATFTAQSYIAFGTTVTVTPSWVAGAAAGAMQMIDRGGNSGEDTPDLLRDWIGTDNRITGDPMTLTISGLPAGTYAWLSYHHDTQDQTGLFDVTVYDATGSRQITGIDITDGYSGVLKLTDVTPFTTTVFSDGSDVSLVFSAQASSPVPQAFFVMNALVLEAQNPCYNQPPKIWGPDALSILADESIVIDITVTDDGKPYIEGCDPNQPDIGTPYGLQYQWSQQSGPVPVGFDPASADVEDINVTFPRKGTYELLLKAWDGPVGDGQEDGKTTEFLVTVEALEPLDGDIDRNGTVDYLDLRILADQWLDVPFLPENTYSADLDGSEGVTFGDFALLSSNWLTKTIRVMINEFVASNRQSLLDGDGNSSDWIELYNGGTDSVFLDGWYLTDDRDNLQKWSFPPGTVLSAGGYLVVFASGQSTANYIDRKGYMHTNFAINDDGEYLALVHSSGRIIHQFAPSFPPQQADISYGMWYATSRYFAVATPGQANELAFIGFADKTFHSHSRGFYDQPFGLRIFCDTPGAFIRYTLDGSEPTEQHGMLYDPDVPIAVTTTTNVRSLAFKPGYRPGDVTTHTYIFVDDVARQPADPPGWPSDWGYSSDAGSIVPADYEMDPRVVETTLPGYSVRDALLDIPTMSISMLPDDFISDATGIYANSQSRWERKCSVEYILPDGTEGFQHDCKIEVHGNASRRPYRMQKHSLRLTFTSLYGPPRLRYPLFDESDVDEFNQLVLRASFTDSWGLVSWSESRYRPNDSQYIRDVWMKESLRDMDQPSSCGSFVHLYVNGLYFGIHNLTERVSEDFFADHLGGDPEDWEINEDLSSPGARWNAMMSIDPSTLSGYMQIQDYLDVQNFADYMLLHFYADSEDWPHHNGYAAANAASGDGMFCFLVWDQEIVLDYHGRAASRINSSGGAGSVFQKMRTSEEFRLLFADRFYKHCFNGGALSVGASQDRYFKIAGWIDKAIVAESARWGDTQMSTPYGNEIRQPSPLDDINHNLYPPAPHGPDYYFAREDSWVVERDNVIYNYIPAIHDTDNSYAIVNVFRGAGLYPGIDPAVFRINGTYQHGGHVLSGDLLTITNPNGTGTIYYTLDGTDPRVPPSSQPDSTNVLVPENAPKRIFVPTGDIGDTWTGGREPYNDSAWNQGVFIAGKSGAVGYERGSGYQNWISYDVESDMYGTDATSAYVRIPFTIDHTDLVDAVFLKLNVRYDDGFAAHINGYEVARSSTVSGRLRWNSTASSHEAAGLETYDITEYIDKLTVGDNILALHGLNTATSSTDFIISAELLVGKDSPGGDISQAALAYTSPIVLDRTAHVKSRLLAGFEWSALAETVFAMGPVAESLRITEIMYNPQYAGSAEDPNEEFIELKNIGLGSIDLNLVSFTRGVDFTFPRMELGAGEYVLVVKKQAAFNAQYPGFSGIIAGEYGGSLDNAGERIRLQDAAGQTIHDFKYKDGWFDITDGVGFSLTMGDPETVEPNDWGGKGHWRTSASVGGSPGWDDGGEMPQRGAVVINEVLAHSHDVASDWIELHNTTGEIVNIGGWFLSDNDVKLMKYEIAEGTYIDPYGYVVFYQETNFGTLTDAGTNEPFALSENGETVYLHVGRDGELMGFMDEEEFDASQTGVSFGRYRKSTGTYNFVPMAGNTPGWTNSYPKVGPIVISELMYHPTDPCAADPPEYEDDDFEYIELRNITDSPVALTEWDNEKKIYVPWWIGGVGYTFGVGTTVPGRGYLIVARDPAAFVYRYGAPPAGAQLLETGYYPSKLDNGGEPVQLSMPGDEQIDAPGEYYAIRVDRVNYSDGSHPVGEDPWPYEPDGHGYSLTKVRLDRYGNDPNNWTAALPSPGE